MTDADEPTPRRVATVLGGLFALQVVSMLLIVAGAVVLLATFAHNNSLDCSAVGFNAVSACSKRSYALPIGLLAGGFGLFLAGMVASATYAMRHLGAPMLGALRARRRLWEQQSDRGPQQP